MGDALMQTVVYAVLVFFLLMAIVRVMGKRELSEMSPFDLVVLLEPDGSFSLLTTRPISPVVWSMKAEKSSVSQGRGRSVWPLAEAISRPRLG